MIPKRKKRQRSGIRDEDGPIRCQGHIQWTRGNCCALEGRAGHVCEGRREVHHVTSFRKLEGGMGQKVGDDKVICLCSAGHRETHDKGQQYVENKYGILMESAANDNWRISPHGVKYRAENQRPLT